MLSLTQPSRCAGDPLCLKIHALEPTLPISTPDLCVTANCDKKLPSVHVVSGWHMFDGEALGFLGRGGPIDLRGSPCFYDWEDDSQGARKWVERVATTSAPGRLSGADCNKLLSWYPAFAGRYTRAWGRSYGPCKTEEMKKLAPGKDYYASDGPLWTVCRPRALAAHDDATGTGGVGHEATPPFVMRTLYGDNVKIISALRNPIDRLETSFWLHTHYPNHYGKSPDGLHKYVSEQTAAFDRCVAAHGARRCAFLFELIASEYSDVFFHCDQFIRGLYSPFVEDWHAAFGKNLLVLRAEDAIDRPVPTRQRVWRFLGVRPPTADAATSSLPTSSYASLHAKGVPMPMRNDTRSRLAAFYRPYNVRLAELLGDPAFRTWA